MSSLTAIFGEYTPDMMLSDWYREMWQKTRKYAPTHQDFHNWMIKEFLYYKQGIEIWGWSDYALNNIVKSLVHLQSKPTGKIKPEVTRMGTWFYGGS